MANARRYIQATLEKHFLETTASGIVDKSPSRLNRGEGTKKNFYILKIDLVGSTMMLRGRHSATYLKLAHTYLSTVDEIAQQFGADPKQMEYAGDGLLAYFAEDEADSEDVLAAACCMKHTVDSLSSLDATMSSLKPRFRLVLHFAELIVAKIGPRNESVLSAIGYPLHEVSKIEKDVPSGEGRVTAAFFNKMTGGSRSYMKPATFEATSVPPPPVPAPQPSPQVNRLAGLLFPSSPPSLGLRNSGLLGPTGPLSTAGNSSGLASHENISSAKAAADHQRMLTLAGLLLNDGTNTQPTRFPTTPSIPPAPPHPKPVPTGYNIDWPRMWDYLELSGRLKF